MPKNKVKFAKLIWELHTYGIPVKTGDNSVSFSVGGNKYLILYANGKFEIYRNGEFMSFARTQHTILGFLQKHEEFFQIGKNEPLYGEERTEVFTIRLPQRWFKQITEKARELNYSSRSSFIRDLIKRGAKTLGLILE